MWMSDLNWSEFVLRGVEFGGFALTILGSFAFYARWQRRAAA